MEAPWLKEGKDCSVRWEGYGLSFSGISGIHMVDFPQKGRRTKEHNMLHFLGG